MHYFYQLGGFRCHFRSLQDAQKQVRLTQDPVTQAFQFVLGIVPSGASYILIPESTSYQPPRDLRNLRKSYDYISLSPVEFTPGEIQAELSSRQPRKGSGDTSQCNKSFNFTLEQIARSSPINGSLIVKFRTSAKEDAVLANRSSRHRGFFEQSRIIYQLGHRSLRPSQLDTFIIQPGHGQLNNIPTVIFYSATRTAILESDRTAHRGKDAFAFRDYAWAELNSSGGAEGSGQLFQRSYFQVKGASIFDLNKPESLHGDSPSEELRLADIKTRLSSLFLSHMSSTSVSGPIIIITYNAQEQLSGLSYETPEEEPIIDVNSWEIGLTTLFNPKEKVHSVDSLRKPVMEDRKGADEKDYKKPIRRQSRSRSPPSRPSGSGRDGRARQPDRYEPRRGERSPSPDVKEDRERPVYVLDLRDLVWATRGVARVEGSPQNELRRLALRLGIPCNLDTWCAANDIDIMYDIWTRFSGGSYNDAEGKKIVALMDQVKSVGPSTSTKPNVTLEPDPDSDSESDHPPFFNGDEVVDEEDYRYGLGNNKLAAPPVKVKETFASIEGYMDDDDDPYGDD